MQYSKLALLAVLATPFAGAQSLADLPACAQQAATGSISQTGCALTDIKCICSASSYLSSLQQSIAKVCSPADQQKTLAFAQSLCGSVGVTISPPAATASATGGSASAPASSAAYPASASTMMTSMVAPSSAAVVSAISDGQPQAPTSVVAVSQISDGQPQGATATVVAVSQLTEGQPQAPTATVSAVSQLTEGQPQAPTATVSAVSQLTEGQPQAPTAAPVSNSTGSRNVTATSSPPPAFTGAASSFGVQWLAAAAVGAAGLFFAGL